MYILKQLMKSTTSKASNSALARISLTNQHLSHSKTTSTSTSNPTPLISCIAQGSKYTPEYKSYATSNSNIISYFHDIPLDLDPNAKEANIVVEIPRWTNGKFEINTSLTGNPITQDIKKGKVRFVKNLFPHHGYIHNYGCFPQTWEDPTYKHLDYYGDNDPLDVCEIGSTVLNTGDVKRVKILGSLAMIDDGEMDWKVIVVDLEDPLSKEVYDIHHLITKCPGLLESTRQWFKDYKLPDGKPQNEFAYNGTYRNASDTINVILECNQSWKELILGKKHGGNLPNITNTTVKESPGYVEKFDLPISKSEDSHAAIPKEIDRQYFISKD